MTVSSLSTFHFTTGARIHFGLMEIHESSPNCYGGIGLMIEEPGIQLKVRVAPTNFGQVKLLAPEVWQTRINNVLKHWVYHRERSGVEILDSKHPNFISGKQFVPVQSMELIYGEPAHQGLGSGTQISSLVAHSLWLAQKVLKEGTSKTHSLPNAGAGSTPNEQLVSQLDPISSQQLSDLSQRGLRSHIGLSGYLLGGLVVDPGRETGDIEEDRYKARAIEHYAFPDWPIVLIQNPEFTGEHGENEKNMFLACAAAPNFNRERMLELIEDDLIPAIQSKNWNRWDRCVGEYGHLAGMIFRDVQSGVFRSQAIRQVVEKLHDLGCQGACQSSWGPTVAVVAQDYEHARYLADAINLSFPKLTTRITAARNTGVGVSEQVE